MAKINLDEGTIQVAGEWLTRDEIVARIQEMMSTGNMRIGTLASNLEMLETELEGSEEIHIVIPRPTVAGIGKITQDKKISVGDIVREALSTYLRSRTETPTQQAPVEEPEEEEVEEEEEEVEEEVEEEEEEEEEPEEEEEWGKPKKVTKIKCPKCGSPITVTSDKRPLEIKCDNCGARGRLR